MVVKLKVNETVVGYEATCVCFKSTLNGMKMGEFRPLISREPHKLELNANFTSMIALIVPHIKQKLS